MNLNINGILSIFSEIILSGRALRVISGGNKVDGLPPAPSNSDAMVLSLAIGRTCLHDFCSKFSLIDNNFDYNFKIYSIEVIQKHVLSGQIILKQ